MVMDESSKGTTRLPGKAYVLVVPLAVLFLAWIYLVFMKDGNTAEVGTIVKDHEPENKLVYLAKEIYYYFWEDARPKQKVEPKSINFVQRLWNYVMP